jgi:predicted DNA-binding transcriptional regulator AlpA
MDQTGFKLRTQKEAARRLLMSLRQFQRLEKRGEGPPRTMLGDRHVGYTDEGLEAWVARRTTSTEAK